ncbi:MAG: class I SAM-dependent methyltransferase [Phycisphaerae bacterium]|nr:class I SAM-dependent methyltransferase [Phycisphaerae bacterium]NUQ45170.1 class I SAM-dependent methyltransferase [Phycisphaerae bacterium]
MPTCGKLVTLAMLIMTGVGTSGQSVQPPASASGPAAVESARDALRREARALEPLIRAAWVKRFLQATADLPAVTPRTVFRDEATRTWYARDTANKLTESKRSALRPTELDERTYYNTKYGTPLAYARPLDVLAEHGLADVAGKRILDFGYGTIGHLRLLAVLGADVVGVDVDTFLPALYTEPADVGAIKGRHGRDGRITLVHGRFPAEPHVLRAVDAGYDVFISKNTLKNGYLHPARPVDRRMLIDLGVSDEKFVREVHRVLKPGGLAIIYNICPAPAPEDKPYIPWADGHSPFSREQWQAAGFRIRAFDVSDDQAVRAQARALGWDEGPEPMDLEKDLFAWFTIVEKPAP